MIVSLLTLSLADMKILRVTDTYSIHRIVYDLFDDVRTEEEKKSSISSGFLYADRGGAVNKREILIVSDRPPKSPKAGSIQSKEIGEAFLAHSHYKFEVFINPTKRVSQTKKLIAIRGREAIAAWFIEKAPSTWGFSVNADTLHVGEMQVNQFSKSQDHITQTGVKLSGEFTVVDREKFINSFKKGIGRGRAFGHGLLQIIPFTKI